MGDIAQLIKLTGIGLGLLLPLANPLTSITLLVSLGAHLSAAERQRVVRQSTLYVFGILCVTFFAGSWIMREMGISLPGLRIAGGLIVAGIGFEMLAPASTPDDIPETDAAAQPKHRTAGDIAFVPLAMPGTAGPGTMAMIISTAAIIPSIQAEYSPWVLHAAPLVVFALVALLYWFCMHFAYRIIARVGSGAVSAVSRVMGFLLVCMGVQFIITGSTDVLKPLLAG